MRLVLFLLSVSASADSLALKDGRFLSGTYLGGSTTTVRFLVGDRVETYPIASVDRIRFGDPGPASVPGRAGLDSSPHEPRTANETPTATTPNVADKQQRFCEVLQSYRESVMRYTNGTERYSSRRDAETRPVRLGGQDCGSHGHLGKV